MGVIFFPFHPAVRSIRNEKTLYGFPDKTKSRSKSFRLSIPGMTAAADFLPRKHPPTGKIRQSTEVRNIQAGLLAHAFSASAHSLLRERLPQ